MDAGAEKTEHSWIDGQCSICGYECIHENVEEDFCIICGKQIYDSIAYRYPVYNIENDQTSGIKEWKNGVQRSKLITPADTTLGEAGKTTWYAINSDETVNLTISGTVTIRGNVNIILEDGAKLTINGTDSDAGINVSNTCNSLTIYGQSKGTGQLSVEGGYKGAGIGGGENGNGENITINGGSVTATGGKFGAGIGGGENGAGENITINGGKVEAKGCNGAGIGGGYNEAGENITINGGEVEAEGSGGAGIGGGYNGVGENITINGGKVEAKGGLGGAGIGGGNAKAGKNITISGGTVIAIGGDNGAGIGGGDANIYKDIVNVVMGSYITISGGTVTATGGILGAGIGGGIYGIGKAITISGGDVTATGGILGAGIGGGSNRDGVEITISGGYVTANGGDQGAGIGGGDNGEGVKITISGGDVTANGGYQGAGIGGGKEADADTVTINGGTVTATGGEYASGIGGGCNGAGVNLTIASELTVNAGNDKSSATVIALNGSTWAKKLQDNTYVYIYENDTFIKLVESSLLLGESTVGYNIYMNIPDEYTSSGSGAYMLIDDIRKVHLSSMTRDANSLWFATVYFAPKDYDSYKVIKFCDGDDNVISLRNSDGKEMVDNSYSFCVKDTIDKINTNSSSYSEKTITEVKLVNNLCRAAKNYFLGTDLDIDQNIEEIAGMVSGCADDSQFNVSFDGVEEREITEIVYLGASLVLDGSPSVCQYFMVDRGIDLADYEFSINGMRSLPYMVSDGVLCLKCSGIGYDYLDDEICYKITWPDGTIVMTMDYNINSYFDNALSIDCSGKLADLVAAIYMYAHY